MKETTENKTFTTEDLPTFAPAEKEPVEVTEETADNVIPTDPATYVLDDVGEFVTLQLAQNPANGQIEMGIVKFPIPLDMARRFQSQLGEAMAEENMKIVIHKGRVYLAPIQTSRIITLN